ncbi:hypothetical protein IV203_022281 [Nitzschia inconspicua]|uniref:Uncharacterized protein n=1 Tax=Nitzschia inconspicua TaxID=303405 RepID=A0A9K3KID1_9STRA|nr:hypothetical protein IV203_022281 [Nitzschia inconspicua]
MEHVNTTPDCKDDKTSIPKMNPKTPPSRKFSVSDLVDPTKPWILTDGGSSLGFFDFVPQHLREGPWNATATMALFSLMYSLTIILLGANMLHTPAKSSILDEFALANDAYLPYTPSWYYHSVVFFWMVYVAYMVYTESMLSSIAWVSFTLWSWSIITIRHGLCALAPFVPQVRVVAEILRLPVLLSASVTFGVWNFVLMPAICFVFIKDSKRRWNFIKFATGFRLTQLHVFNIFFAVMNGAWAQPRRPLHLGDLDAVFVYMSIYMMWYYFVLDRLGIHLYPIFSPRVPWVIFSWLLVVGLCIYGYQWWGRILSPSSV